MLRYLLIGAALLAAFWLLQPDRSRTPDALKYVSPNAGIVAAAPNVEVVWTVLRGHLSALDAGSGCGKDSKKLPLGDVGPIGEGLAKIRCELSERGIRVDSLSAIESQGIRTNGSGAVGIFVSPDTLAEPKLRPRDEPRWIVVLPLSDRKTFLATVTKQREKPPLDCADKLPEGEQACLLVTADDYAIVTNEPSLAHAAVARTETFARAWQSNDDFRMLGSEAFQPRPGERELAKIFLRGTTGMAFSLYGDVNRLMVRGRVNFSKLVARVLRSFVEPTALSASIPKVIASADTISLAFVGDDLGARLEYLKEVDGGAYNGLKQTLARGSLSFEPLLDVAIKSRTLTGLGLSTLNAREGVPEITAALLMPESEAGKLVAQLQETNSKQRQQKLHDRVVICLKDENAEGCPKRTASIPRPDGVSIDEVARRELARYDVPEAGSPEFCLVDENPCPPEARGQYVAPAANQNDIDWLAGQNDKPEDRAAEVARLSGGEYRLASFYDAANQRLLISLDVPALKTAMASFERNELNNARFQGQMLAINVDPRWVWSQSLLAEKDVDALARDIGADLQAYRSLKVTALPMGVQDGIALEISIER